MKIAIAYDDGKVFQDFDKAESFMIYEMQDGQVIPSSIISFEGNEHSDLAGMLSGQLVNIVICGDIGENEKSALSAKGIKIYSGASGDVDAAVEAFLRDEMKDSGSSCDKQGRDGSCGGCSGGCQTGPQLNGRNVGKKVRTHYLGTLNDGTQFDSSYDRGEPLEFVCGAGQMIAGFDAAVADMEVGQTIQVHLMPSEAYGEVDPNAIITVPLARLPGAEELAIGQHVSLHNTQGQSIPVTVQAKDDDTITFDANHDMAGKELNFTIELLEVLDD